MAAPSECAPRPPAAAAAPPVTQPSWRVVDLFCAGGEQWKDMLANAAYGDQDSQVRAYKRLNENVQKATRHRQLVTWACAGVFMAGVFSALQSWWHPAFLSTAAVFLLPKRSWYMGLIPINLASYGFYHYVLGANVLDARIVMQGVMNCCACVYVQLVTDDKEWQFFQSILETERMRLELEGKMTMVQRLMDSLFDACCLCEEDGRIAGTSPYLEQLLGGQLAGCGLLDLARNAEERSRARRFLADLVNNRVAGKMNLSLQLPAGCPRVCGNLETDAASIVDVTVSGIALPSSSDSRACAGRIYLGFQAETSTPPPASEEATPQRGCGRLSTFRTKTGISEFGGASHAGMTATFSNGIEAERMSCYSAPAILMPRQLLQFLRTADTAVSCADPDGDCLPPDVLVWVEGRAAPVPVKSVSVGMRVLCHDRLSRGMKFAAIVEAEVHAASPGDWVTLILEDGTELEVTEDHPVFPHTSGAGAGGVVRAAELQAGFHAVEVLRMVPVGVREVRRRSPGLDEAAAPAERVALSVQQPDRHAIFVAPRPDLVAGVAVASANMGGDEVVDYNRACVKNTFFDAFPDEEEQFGVRRSGSCPAVVRVAEAAVTSRSLPASPSSRAQLGFARSPRATSSKASVISFSTFKSSERSDVASLASSGAPGVQLVLGAPALSRSTAGLRGASAMPLPSMVSLGDALGLRRDGLQSLGSAAHAAGECVPCLMQARFNSGKCAAPCKFGVLCGRCHEPHTERNLQRIQTKMGRLRRRRGAEVSTVAGDGA